MYNFQSCHSNAVMCCWVQDRHNENAVNNGNCRAPYPENCIDKDPADNTDVCNVDMSRSRKSNHVDGGKALYHDNFDQSDSQTEGKSHCHGFAWKNDKDSPSFVYRGNNLFYVSLYDHFYQRGYVRNIPGAPMCSCTKKAAIVSRSDCTEMQVEETITVHSPTMRPRELSKARITNVDIVYTSCTSLRKNNDLSSYYERLDKDGDISTSMQVIFNIQDSRRRQKISVPPPFFLPWKVKDGSAFLSSHFLFSCAIYYHSKCTRLTTDPHNS